MTNHENDDAGWKAEDAQPLGDLFPRVPMAERLRPSPRHEQAVELLKSAEGVYRDSGGNEAVDERLGLEHVDQKCRLGTESQWPTRAADEARETAEAGDQIRGGSGL